MAVPTHRGAAPSLYNARMAMQLKNLARLDDSARDAIRQQAAQHRLAQGV